MKLSNKAYDVIKIICLIVLPALVVLITVTGDLCGLSDETVKTAAGTITGIATALGGLVGISSATYWGEHREELPVEEPSEPIARIYLSPSEQSANKYAVGHTDEATQCKKIAAACAAALRARNFQVILEPDVQVVDRVKIDKDSVDWYIPIHTNAFDGKVTGTRIMCRSAADVVDKTMAEFILHRVDAVCPGTSSNISYWGDQWYEQRETKPVPNVYIEAEFHDVPETAQFIIDHTTEIGEAIARGICDFYDVAW